MAAFEGMSVAQLKAELSARNIDTSSCYDKQDLIDLARGVSWFRKKKKKKKRRRRKR